MVRCLRVSLLWLAAVASACALQPRQPADLGQRLDCLRDRHAAVIAAHRGQPDQTFAENAMSSFSASLAAGITFLEIDVATTKDGVLVLMHDDTLDRTTTGTGAVADRTWAEIQALRITRPDGTVTNDGVPSFASVLAWGRKTGAHFELDVKRTTAFSAVVEAVRAAGMQDRVLVVTYTLADAQRVHQLDPTLVISVTMEQPEDVQAAVAVLPPARMLGWSGTRDPERRPFAAMRAAGIEPIFGTLGRPGTRLDDVYLADGNPSEYGDLVRAGVVMIATDNALVAQRAIGTGLRGCFR